MPDDAPLPPGFEHRYIDVNGVRLHLVEGGPPDGPLALLLHGFPEFWYGWRAQLEAFARRGFRVWAPDQRGYNLSDKPRGLSAYRLDTLAEDVVGLIGAAGRDAALLVAHDWGGLVAWRTAVRFPSRIRRLAVLNVPHPQVLRHAVRHHPAQRKKSWYIRYFQLPWLPERWFRKDDWKIGVRSVQGTARPGAFSDDDMQHYRRAWSRPGAIRAMIDWYRAAVRRRWRPVPSHRVSVPTLLLWGTRDRFLSHELVQPSLDLCDDGQAVLFPEATHWIQHEEPERVNRLLLGFFEEDESA